MKLYILFTILLYICATYSIKLNKVDKRLSTKFLKPKNPFKSVSKAFKKLDKDIKKIAYKIGDFFKDSYYDFAKMVEADYKKMKSGSIKANMTVYPAADIFNESNDPNQSNGVTVAIPLPVTMNPSFSWVNNNNSLGYPVIQGEPRFQGICGSCWVLYFLVYAIFIFRPKLLLLFLRHIYV